MPAFTENEDPKGTATPTLRVYLLGQPEATWAGRPLALERRQVRALLYRLAADLRPVPREKLCYLFWPDSPEASARRNLRGLLTHLRRALPVPGLVITSGETAGLDPEKTWCDTAAFEQLGTTGWVETGLAQQAVDLYRGPFLAGFSLPGCPEFELWATTERRSQERHYLEALAALIQERAASDDYAAAITHAQRYLAVDELAEEIHRRLIELYAANQDRSAALRQYERCASILERELGVEPLPQTQATYRAVLAGHVATRGLPRHGPSWTTLPGLEGPMVGREGALRQLEQALAQAKTGHGSVILISGEAGVGKSRLLQEFAARVQDGTLVLAGAGYPDAQMTPYQPAIEALRQALAGHPLPPATAPAWLAEASRLLPELRDLVPGLPSPLAVEPGLARPRLFEALCQLLLGLADGPDPVLLCLDDLHWADGTTLDWLGHLGRRLHGSRLLVLGTYQVEEAGAIARLRRSLGRWGILSDLVLAPLGEGAIRQLMDHLGPQARGLEVTAGQLYRATGGNPFFLLETLRALIESSVAGGEGEPGAAPAAGDALLAQGQALPLPRTIQAAVQARVERLGAGARQVLEASAVLGRAFSFELVHLAAGRREMETMDGLDELAGRQLLAEQGSRYVFRHQVVQWVVYHNLSQRRRSLLHRRAGEALEKVQSSDTPALAWHFECAGALRRAAKYALQAGQSAKAVFGHAEARAYFDRALALLEREAEGLRPEDATSENRRLRLQALYERGWALRLLGQMEAYARDLQEVVRLVEEMDDPCTLAHLRWREAYAHRWFCRYSEARQAAADGLRLRGTFAECTFSGLCQEEGVGSARATGYCPFQALCWREVGMAAREMGDYEQAEASLTRALDRFVMLGATGYEIQILGNLSTLQCYMGEYEKARDLACQALARCEETGLNLERRLPLGDLGAATAALGDGKLAREALLESLSIARQIDDRTQEIFCLGHLGWLYARLRQPAQALLHLTAAMALVDSINSSAERSWLMSGLAEAHRINGEAEAARASALGALEVARATHRRHDQEVARRILNALEAS
jgi:DNA-binding SARP family transcriptional activator